MNSYVYRVDNTGVANAKIIQIYGNKDKRVATCGDIVYVVVKSLDRSSGNLKDEKQRKRFRKGSLHRAVVVHTKKKIKRIDNTWMWFNSNSVVLVDKRGKPLSRRIRSVIPREIANKYPAIASITSLIV